MATVFTARLELTEKRRLEASAAGKGVSASDLFREWVNSLPATPAQTWDEILADVRKAAATVRPEDSKPNPVLAQRKKRNFHERLR